MFWLQGQLANIGLNVTVTEHGPRDNVTAAPECVGVSTSWATVCPNKPAWSIISSVKFQLRIIDIDSIRC
jgi:hypothetical protein